MLLQSEALPPLRLAVEGAAALQHYWQQSIKKHAAGAEVMASFQ